MAESSIVRSIMRHAERIPRLLLRKRHGDEFSVAGDPDLSGCYKGWHIEIEVKRPGESPDQLQAVRLREWRAVGAYATWLTGPEEFDRWIEDMPINIAAVTLQVIALSNEVDPANRQRATDALAVMRSWVECAMCHRQILVGEPSRRGVHERCAAKLSE